MQKLLLLFFLFILGSSTLSAQNLSHVLGDVLVRPVAGQEIESLISNLRYFEGNPTRLQVVEQISRPLNIWRLNFDHTVIHEQHFLRFLQANPKIETVQFNHLVTMRETIPNDTFFDDQWQYINMGQNGGVVGADIDADLAWDITTGGVTPFGDTIVVAVLDDGIDIGHEDFGDNLWLNHAEIPNNGIDDDGNGYVDDYLGWNINSNNDNINGGGHGTPVAGIVGAQGNNELGVTGVNWDVKVMVIRTDFNTNEADVIEAYSYVLEARQLYNESNGDEGAFVVSTNASWGIDFGQPEDAPLWCAFYDTLGHAGILNCGATINGNQNVDEIGDLPTACPSDFMISVTNMNRTDNKVTNAGYGLETIDLGAFGANTYTTADNNSYGGFGGTSGATPHVTGAIALLYSAPCDNLISIAKADPGQAALLARQYILEGVDPNPSLDGITVTGGRLNMFNSLNDLMNNCVPCLPPGGLDAEDITSNTANLSWFTSSETTSNTLRWRLSGTEDWTVLDSVNTPVPLTGLTECTMYEFQVTATCDTLDSGYSPIETFTTDGCCTPPNGLTLSNLGEDQASFTWIGLTAAQSYNVLLSNASTTILYEDVTSSEIDIFDLSPCETYSVSVQTNCADSTTAFGTAITFTTLGCGACFDFSYCETTGENSSFEWIDSVQIGDLLNFSGDNGGYIAFTDAPTTFTTFNSYPVRLVPGFSGTLYDEYWKIWIDFNQDGVFDDPGELAYDGIAPTAEASTGSLLIPGTAMLGSTRMRVSMEWEGNDGTGVPEPCESFGFGEVEDYCIDIIEGAPSPCDAPVNLDTVLVATNLAQLNWSDATDDHIDHNVRVKRTNETDWALYSNVTMPFEVTNLVTCIEYEFQVQGNCADGVSQSEFSESFVFTTAGCITSSTGEATESISMEVFPNPFTSDLVIDLNLASASDIQLELLDMSGRILHQEKQNAFAGSQQIIIDNLSHLSAGVYLLKVQTEQGAVYQKLIK